MNDTRMLNRSENGFFVVEIGLVILVIVVLIGAGILIAKRRHNQALKKSGQEGHQTYASQNEPDIVLHNLGVTSLDSIDINPQATSTYKDSGHKGFYVFGDALPGTPVRHNPNFEFDSVKAGTQLISAIDGVVGFVQQQKETNDYELYLMPSENSNWVISYDHIINLKVAKGDKVSVGTILGNPAPQNNGLLRYEFQINKNKNGQDGMHICPTTLLASDVRDKFAQQLRTMQDTWERVSGLDLYDPTHQDPIGCLMKDMTPAYANGVL